MRVRFYTVTITNWHLTRDVIVPSRNIASARLGLSKDDTYVLDVKYLGSYHVDILIGERGLYFRAHMDNNQVVSIIDGHRGFSYLRESLSNQRKTKNPPAKP
jgi:hypothetical protein